MKTILFSFFLLVVIYSNAQNGIYDSIYNQVLCNDMIDASGPTGGTIPSINCIVEQPDGKLLVGGSFFSFNQKPYGGIVRLFPDGKIDSSFHEIQVLYVFSICLQADGKILIGGSFTDVNNVPYMRIARLESNGDLDLTFNIGLGFNSIVNDLEVDVNGKILVAGSFSSIDGNISPGIARLNNDGSYDNTFNVGAGPDNSYINCIISLSDGTYFLGGSFTSFNSISINSMVHVNSNGNVLPSFISGFSSGSIVRKIKQDSFNNIWVAGTFVNYNNSPVGGILPLQLSGNINPGFTSNQSINSLYDFTFTTSNEIVGVGGFNVQNGSPSNYIIGFEQSGVISTSLNFYSGVNDIVYAVHASIPGKIIVGGIFDNVQGYYRPKLGQFSPSGYFDPSFLTIPGPNGIVNKVIAIENNQSIVAGKFTHYNGVPCHKMVRVNSDGTLDQSFQFYLSNLQEIKDVIKLPTNGYAVSCCIIPNGNDTIVKIDNNGNLDPVFAENVPANTFFKKIIAQPDGKLLLSLNSNLSGYYNQAVIRLKPDGSLDSGFYLAISNFATVDAFDIFPNGKIVICGYNQEIGTAWGNYVRRFNPDGTTDTSFLVSFQNGLQVSDLKVLNTGQIMILGNFNQFDGVNTCGVVKLNYTGIIDPSFSIPPNAMTLSNGLVLEVLTNGYFLVSGGNKLVQRFLPNGDLDPNFQIYTQMSGSAITSAINSDGSILLGGNFKLNTNCNYRFNLIKINNDEKSMFPIRVGYSEFIDAVTCNDSASCTAYGYFGVPPYTFEWINSNPVNYTATQYFTEPGIYNLKVMDAVGDSLVVSFQVFGDGFPCDLSVPEIKNNVSIIPNPFSSEIEIIGSYHVPLTYEIINVNGVIVSKGLIQNVNEIINLSTINPGVYMIYLKKQNQELIKVQKIVKY